MKGQIICFTLLSVSDKENGASFCLQHFFWLHIHLAGHTKHSMRRRRKYFGQRVKEQCVGKWGQHENNLLQAVRRVTTRRRRKERKKRRDEHTDSQTGRKERRESARVKSNLEKRNY